MIVVPSGASAGAASTTFDGSPDAEADVLSGADAGAALPEFAAAIGSADVVWAAVAGDGVAAFAAPGIAGWAGGAEREDARAFGLSLGAAATEAGGNAGFVGMVTVADAAVGAAGATDGTAAVRTLVTIARAATGVFSGSFGRSMRESTTPAPAVAPMAVATKTTRAVRAKLGAGAK